MSAQHKLDIPKNKIELSEPIKAFGTFQVKVKLYPEVAGTLYVVVAEEK